MYNEMKIFWARTKYHSEYYMTGNADINFCIHNANLFKTKQMAKSTLKVKMNGKSWEAIKMIGPWTYLHKYWQDVNKPAVWFMLSIYCGGVVLRFTRLFESTINIIWYGLRAKRKAGTGQNDKEAAHSDSNLYSVLQLEASSPIENYTLRKLSRPCLSVLECIKHAESTNNCREKQILLSIGRDAEEILNS